MMAYITYFEHTLIFCPLQFEVHCGHTFRPLWCTHPSALKLLLQIYVFMSNKILLHLYFYCERTQVFPFLSSYLASCAQIACAYEFQRKFFFSI